MPTNNTGGTPARGFVASSGTTTTSAGTINAGGGGWTLSATQQMEEVLREARRQAMRRNVDPELVAFDSPSDIFEAVETPSMPMPLDCEILKKRHLNKNERQAYHKPKRDWELTNKGEVCKSACSLVVDDLVE